MPRTLDLPPPPEHPALPPEALVSGETAITLTTEDGLQLEALGRFDPSATCAVTLCHPHPLYGGTMHNAIVLSVTKALFARGAERVATLRFNFRGVGRSQGGYDEGRGEVLDARAALSEARRRAPSAAQVLVGYSFGSWVGMRAAAHQGHVDRVALVAPAVRIFPFVEGDARGFGGRIAVFVGDHDEFCDVAEAQKLAETLSAPLHVFSGADHYFMRQRRDVGQVVASFAFPEVAPHGD
jgi:alpha/beta superfamily hydrolase